MTTTPLGSPAAAAGPSATTSATAAPWALGSSPSWTPKRGVRSGAGRDQFVGDALGLIRRDRETQPDRTALRAGGILPPPPPIDAMAEFTPTSSPFMFTNAPPELPGLIAASVWIAFITECWPVLSSPVVTGRSRALMMPVVTVPCSPSGEPMATTF